MMKMVGFVVMIIVLGITLPALIIMIAWNELLVDLAKSLRTITFWEALLISIVINIVIAPFKRRS